MIVTCVNCGMTQTVSSEDDAIMSLNWEEHGQEMICAACSGHDIKVDYYEKYHYDPSIDDDEW